MNRISDHLVKSPFSRHLIGRKFGTLCPKSNWDVSSFKSIILDFTTLFIQFMMFSLIILTIQMAFFSYLYIE